MFPDKVFLGELIFRKPARKCRNASQDELQGGISFNNQAREKIQPQSLN